MNLETGLDVTLRGFGYLLIVVGFIIFFGIIAYTICITKKNKKRNSGPVKIEMATVVAKRMKYIDVTWYYITFQLENGSRREFLVSGKDYGMIAEQDKGKLEHQGKRFISFNRE